MTSPLLAGSISTTYGTGSSSLKFSSVPIVTPITTARGTFSDFQTIVIPPQQFNATILSSFPVLVQGTFPKLANTGNGGLMTDLSAEDMVFSTNPAGEPILNTDTETYVSTSGYVAVWVQVPFIYSSQTVQIYWFYGNSGISNPQWFSSACWDSNYQGVYHLGSTGTATQAPDPRDSTKNKYNGTLSGSPNPKLIAGKISGGATYNGTSAYTTIGNQSGLTITGALTIEAWVNAAGQNNVGFVSKYDATSNNRGYLMYSENIANGTKVSFSYQSAGSVFNSAQAVTSNSSILTSVWNHVVGVYVPSVSGSIYFNGNLNNVNTASVPASIFSTAANFEIGSFTNGTALFTGNVDEVRVSNIARSADWIRTEYLNQSDPAAFSYIAPKNTAVMR